MSEDTGDLTFEAQSELPQPPAQVFAWHERQGAFARLSPPWEDTQMVSRQGTIFDGDVTVLKVAAGPARVLWEARHFGYQAGVQFCDEQVRGPFAKWVHRHKFVATTAGTRAEDHVQYRPPAGALGRALSRSSLEKSFHRMFAYRHQTLAADLARHASYTGRPLRVLVAGASGLVGSALCAFLSTGGHEVVRLVRSQSQPPADAVGATVDWDPVAGKLDAAQLGPIDAVVNLAGENVAAGRWTDERKRRLRTSRVDLTAFLAAEIAKLNPKPAVLVNASAMGFYGDTGDAEVREGEGPGQGFLSQLSQDWEAATAVAQAAGVRVALPRIGLVLTPQEGVLAKLLPPFRAGVGGRLGNGKQWMSWIALDDLVGVFHQALVDQRYQGPINAAAPELVRNSAFAETLGQVLGRPTLFTVPAFALKLALGEMGAMAMMSTRMVPARLLELGFGFRFPTLRAALDNMLGTEPLPPLQRHDGAAKVVYGLSPTQA